MLLREKSWGRRLCATALAAAVAGCLGSASAGAGVVRHYEKVSPADKGQGDIVADGITTIAARGGDGVAFDSRTPFGDTIGSGVSGHTQFIARRGADGSWSTHAITPRPRPDALQTLVAGTRLQTYSDDLSTAVVWAYDLPDVDGDTPRRNNVYVEDTATRALQPITTLQASPFFFFYFLTTTVWGMSADAQHIAIVTPTALLPDAAAGVNNVYQWDNGVLRVAGVLPDGSVPPTGSDVVPANYRGAMSEDGSRLAFTASDGGPNQLYLRIDGNRTVWVSQPEGSDTSEPTGVQLEAMTPNGRDVFFVTDSRLLDSDPNTTFDIYRYRESANPASDGNLTLVTNTGDVDPNNNGNSVVGVSDDGERVYYNTSGDRLVVWDHGTTRVISTSVVRDPTARFDLPVTASQPGYGRVTPDGEYMAFLSRSTLGQDLVHGLDGHITNAHYELYLYTLRTGDLQCLSCPSNQDATADVSVTPGSTNGNPTIDNAAARPRYLSDRGQVFFSTLEALVPQDRNGAVDAYEYDPADGTLSLLSSGTGSDPSTFADASANGDDVFIATRQKLTSDDSDNLVDLYDVRFGPAPPAAPASAAPPCDGESCQGPPSGVPSEDTLGSLTLEDSGTSGHAHKTLAVKHRVTFHGAAGSLRVRLTTAGKLSWHGKGLRSGSLKRHRSGSVVLRIRLSAHARKQLSRSGRYVTSVRLTFVLADGSRASGSTRITFTAPAKKGR